MKLEVKVFGALACYLETSHPLRYLNRKLFHLMLFFCFLCLKNPAYSWSSSTGKVKINLVLEDLGFFISKTATIVYFENHFN